MGDEEQPPAEARLAPFPRRVVAAAARSAACVDYGRLVTTPEGLYSALMPAQAPQVVRIFDKWFPNLARLRPLAPQTTEPADVSDAPADVSDAPADVSDAPAHVIDATANVGGDTLNLLHHYPGLRARRWS